MMSWIVALLLRPFEFEFVVEVRQEDLEDGPLKYGDHAFLRDVETIWTPTDAEIEAFLEVQCPAR